MERCLTYFPRYALYTIIGLSMCILELQFITFVLLLKQHCAGVNTQLGSVYFIAKLFMRLANIYQPRTLNTLDTLYSPYYSLCDVAESLNCMYSPVIPIDIGLVPPHTEIISHSFLRFGPRPSCSLSSHINLQMFSLDEIHLSDLCLQFMPQRSEWFLRDIRIVFGVVI
jgi:hypothetical protein